MAEDCGIPGSLLKVERQTLYEVDGVPMMRRFFEYNEKIRNFEAKPDDVLIIYVARNAKDVLVSYYFFHKLNLRMPETGSWEEFFESYLSGKVAWGSWFDHVTTWWDIRQRQQVLYIFYEDIVQDPQRVIERVSPFLGRTFGRTVIDEIMKHTAFSNMKDNPMTNFSNLPWFNLKVSPFMRKGKVGDWKNHFTVAQNERFEKEYQRRMAKTSLRFTDDL
ncbi:S1C2A Sulfotransferase, partial [Polypterus senegalus]